jgi:hypothetical protein
MCDFIVPPAATSPIKVANGKARASARSHTMRPFVSPGWSGRRTRDRSRKKHAYPKSRESRGEDAPKRYNKSRSDDMNTVSAPRLKLRTNLQLEGDIPDTESVHIYNN